MTDEPMPGIVDTEHIRRSGATISDYGRDLSALIRDLTADLAVTGRWTGPYGGDAVAATLTGITTMLLSKLRRLAMDLVDIGADLQGAAADLEASDERAEAALRKVGRGL